MQPQQEINPLGIPYNNGKDTFQTFTEVVQPTKEQQLKTTMRKFDIALEELLPLIAFSQMDVPTFVKFKADVDSRIYKVRNPKYDKGNSRIDTMIENHAYRTTSEAQGDKGFRQLINIVE